MRIVIAGGRSFDDWDYFMGYMSTLPTWIGNDNFEVVSGGAPGVDSMGEQLAYLFGLKLTKFPADWNKHGRAAGPIRNEQMALYADGVIAFWDGKSRGTKHMIETARKNNKWTYVVRTDIVWDNQSVDSPNNVFFEGTPTLKGM
jgi:hypothetical protein